MDQSDALLASATPAPTLDRLFPGTSPGGALDTRDRAEATPGSHPDPPAEATGAETGEGRRWLAILGDGLALLLLAGVLLYFERHDGGRTRKILIWVSLIGLANLPVAMAEARRIPRIARVLLALWGLAGLASIVFAVERSGFVMPAMILGLVPIVGLATHRIWRRPWGPIAILGLLSLAFVLYTRRSFLQWWGDTMAGGRIKWAPLSWHNQSGALMGAFAAIFAGTALFTRRITSWGLAFASGIALSGVWLSSSRGAILFTALGFAVVATLALRVQAATRDFRESLLVMAGKLVAVAVVAAIATGALLSMYEGPTPLESRGAPAIATGTARLRHMAAALGMFADRPVTGQGLGSYRSVALEFTPVDANLTSSAHNEYAETLAEGGLLLAVPFWSLSIGAIVLALRRLRRPVRLDEDPESADRLRVALTLGITGSVAIIATHSAVDFDWDYPILPILLAMGVAVMVADRPRRVDDRTRPKWHALAALPVGLLLLVGVAGGGIEQYASQERAGLSAEEYAQVPAPWQWQRAIGIAQELEARGRTDLATDLLADAKRWNPYVQNIETTEQLLAFDRGDATAGDLINSLEPGPSGFDAYIVVADRLVSAGEYDIARSVLADVLGQLDARQRWGVGKNQASAWETLILLEARENGCERAGAAANEALEIAAIRDDRQNVDVITGVLEGECPAAAA